MCFCVLSASAIGTDGDEVSTNNDSKVVSARLKFVGGYNVETLFAGHHTQWRDCPAFEVGVGTDVGFKKYVTGLVLQAQASYLAYHKHQMYWDAPGGTHDYFSSHRLRLAFGPQYVIGHWPVRPTVRGGVSGAFDMANFGDTRCHWYAGAGCEANVKSHLLALHLDYWTHSSCRFFVTLEFAL